VKQQAPELFAEWRKPINPMEARLHLERNGVPVPRIASFITMGPETVRMLNLFAHKVVLCLHFEHFEQHLTNDGRVAAFWRTKEDFARGVPKILLEMMREYGTLEQGKWNVSEAFEYRYSLNKPGGYLRASHGSETTYSSQASLLLLLLWPQMLMQHG
jgi:hypothetical protein